MTIKPIHKITIGLSLLFILGCSPAEETASAPTKIVQTIQAKESATAAIENALAAVLTGTASMATATNTPTNTATATLTSTVTPTPPAHGHCHHCQGTLVCWTWGYVCI